MSAGCYGKGLAMGVNQDPVRSEAPKANSPWKGLCSQAHLIEKLTFDQPVLMYTGGHPTNNVFGGGEAPMEI